MNAPLTPSPTGVARRLTFGLVLGLFVWGTYLAIGAWLFNRDIRKGFIVFGCSLAFLGLWAVLLAIFRQRDAAQNRSTGNRNWACLAALGCGCVALLSMLLPVARIASSAVHGGSLVTSMITMVIALILALVGLSDRQRPTWNWMGMVALVLVASAMVAGFLA